LIRSPCSFGTVTARRLGVGANAAAETVRDARQRAGPLAARQQLVRAERARGEHHPARTHGPAAAAQPRAGALRRDLVALGAVGRADRPDVDDLALREHLDAGPLGEPQVVLDQRVLGVERAADHAAPAQHAAGAVGSLTAEVGIGGRHARLAEVDADARLGVGVVGADLAPVLAQQLVGRVVGDHLRDAEHPLGLVVVGRQRRLPIVELRPLAVGVEALGRAVERVRVSEGAAADAGAGDDGDVAERRQAEDPRRPSRGA